MSRKAEDSVREIRALRNAAKGLVQSDVANLKGDLQARNIASRMADRATEGVMEIYDEASAAAASHRGTLAGLAAASALGAALWIFRDSLFGTASRAPDGTSDDHDAL